MNFVFLMDPLSTVIMEKDTSFNLMLAAYRKGHRVYFLPDGGMTLRDGKIFFHVQEVIPQISSANPFIRKNQVVLNEKNVHAVFVRSDPPFDGQYLLNTWLLDHLPKRIPVINSPSGLRVVNEKIWAAQFTALIPPTLIGRHKQDLVDFIHKHKHVVVKPTDGHGGKAVFQIKAGEPNTNVILETVTENFTRDIVMQKYVAESQKGDKRILLLNGEPLGAVLRLHAQDDHRNNIFAGGKTYSTQITARDKKIISVLKPHVRNRGLYFVGIDILGDYLVEVNVTSPTCLQEMNYLYKQHLENKVIAFVEKLTRSPK